MMRQQIDTTIELSVCEMETFESDGSCVGGNFGLSFATVRDSLMRKYSFSLIPGNDLLATLRFGKERQCAKGLGRIGYNRLKQIHVVAKPTRDGGGLKKFGAIIAVNSKLVGHVEDIQDEIKFGGVARIAERDAIHNDLELHTSASFSIVAPRIYI